MYRIKTCKGGEGLSEAAEADQKRKLYESVIHALDKRSRVTTSIEDVSANLEGVSLAAGGKEAA